MIRRIETQSEIDRKRKIRKTVLSILMLSILVLSTLGFAFFSNPGQTTDNNEQQKQKDKSPADKINFEYQGSSISLVSTYNEVESIAVNISNTLAIYQGKPLYIVSSNDGIFREIALNLQALVSRVQKACYEKCEENLPEKNCTDNLIIWNHSLEKRVFQEENCIFIEGDMTAADAFLYKLFNP